VPPFHPDTAFPEYPFPPFCSGNPNYAYSAVRDTLRLLKLDAMHYGTAHWNPLGDILHPGDRVVVKPNYVIHAHFSDLTYDCVVTHSSVLRAVIDYALKAVGPEGMVTVADAPLRDADFDEILRRCRLDEVLAFYQEQGHHVGLLDMRHLRVVQQNGLVLSRHYNPDQLSTSRVVDLGPTSAFRDIEHLMHRVAGADYERWTTRWHHTGGRHEYCVSQHILDADAVLCVGKIKTHKKTGVTLSMKNLVGINVDKNFLPHYRIGMPSQGGDEFPDRPGWSQKARQWLIRAGIELLLARAERLSVPIVRKLLPLLPKSKSDGQYAAHYSSTTHPGYNQKMIERFYSLVLGSNIRDGNWWGNDTAWRMVVDLNTILLYCDRDGQLRDTPARRYFSILDGILGGAGEGPMNPTPMPSGVVLAGHNPLSVDWCATQLMGFDPDQLNVISGARKRLRPLGPDDPPVLVTEDASWSQGLQAINSLRFPPHSCWPDIQVWH
jgi:uncharacterized protein (DUF362 family)